MFIIRSLVLLESRPFCNRNGETENVKVSGHSPPRIENCETRLSNGTDGYVVMPRSRFLSAEAVRNDNRIRHRSSLPPALRAEVPTPTRQSLPPAPSPLRRSYPA